MEDILKRNLFFAHDNTGYELMVVAEACVLSESINNVIMRAKTIDMRLKQYELVRGNAEYDIKLVIILVDYNTNDNEIVVKGKKDLDFMNNADWGVLRP